MGVPPDAEIPQSELDSRSPADTERDAVPVVSALAGAGTGAAGLAAAAATGALAGLPGGPAGAAVGAVVGLIAGGSAGGALGEVTGSLGVDADGNIAPASGNEEPAGAAGAAPKTGE